ncbi:MAG: hypothetical protein GX285_07335 [Clostridiales bacterium]|nr:hypothetical protein [Clostridiales bacterium]
MLVNRNLFIVVAIIIMVVLLLLNIDIIIAAVIALVIAAVGYVVVNFKKSKKRLNLLEEDCDPEAFLANTEKQRIAAKGNAKTNTYLDLDMAAGLMAAGDFNKAKEILASIDKAYLAVENGTLFIYAMNYIICLYELGETRQAEKMYKTEISDILAKSRFVPLYKILLDAERNYFLKEYDESRELYNDMLRNKISKGKQLQITYRLAQIDEIEGDTDAAKEKYREVAERGNKLWIAEQAKMKL